MKTMILAALFALVACQTVPSVESVAVAVDRAVQLEHAAAVRCRLGSRTEAERKAVTAARNAFDLRYGAYLSAIQGGDLGMARGETDRACG